MLCAQLARLHALASSASEIPRTTKRTGILRSVRAFLRCHLCGWPNPWDQRTASNRFVAFSNT
jgi:hypothetical protein